MSTFIKSLIKKLNTIDWSNLPVSFPQIEEILGEIYLNKIEELNDYLDNISTEEFNEIDARSKETTTHFKWILYKSSKFGYSIRLHQYKNDDAQRQGYANTIHNHRYWFASLILQGGYQHKIYKQDTFEEGEIQVVSATLCVNGNTYFLPPDVIHSVTEIQENTLTLVISSPAMKDFSTSMTMSDKKVINHYHATSFKNLLNRKNIAC